VRGAGLTGVTAVTFGGVPATNVAVLADTLVRASVPAAATTGPIAVTGPNGGATSVQSFTVLPPPPVSSWSFTPIADGHVHQGSASSNFGSLTTMRARVPDYRFFLKFDVQGVTGPVTSAKLRLYVTDESSSSGSVFLASNLYSTSAVPWTEAGITWSNAPTLSGAAIAGPVNAPVNTWVELDVTSAVAGNGVVSFGVTSAITNSVYYATKEGANRPVLDVRTGGVAQAAHEQPARADFGGDLPSTLEVGPARPNPFTHSTLISYALPRDGRIRLTVYSVMGQVVSRPIDRFETAGFGQAIWDGTDARGRRVAPGVYLYRFEFGGESRRGKLLLME
jgi:hypothetical protein